MNKATRTDYYKVDPRLITVVEGFNSRQNFGNLDELAAQIKEQGILNPISVIPFKDSDGTERYRLVDGERRYRAVMKLISEGVEIARVPAMFLSKSLTEEELLIQQALRNEGKNFNEYEYAILSKKMMDRCGLTATEVATRLGKNPGQVVYYLQILEMDKRVQELVRDDKISGSNVRRIYSAHKGDEEAAVNEILGLKQIAEEKGEEKISLKNLNEFSKTVEMKDSKCIKKGLERLFFYIKKYETEEGIDIDLTEIYNSLSKNKTITEIFEGKIKEYRMAQ